MIIANNDYNGLSVEYGLKQNYLQLQQINEIQTDPNPEKEICVYVQSAATFQTDI